MICERCNEREATVHVTTCVSPPGETTNHNFCEACSRREGSTGDLPDVTGDERCYHCGGAAGCCTENVGPAFRARKQKHHWVCPRCFRIECKFMVEETELPKLPRGLSEADSEQWAEALYRRADAFVQQAIRGEQDR